MYIRKWTAEEAADFWRWIRQSGDGNISAKIVAECALTENGARIFGREDAEIIGQWGCTAPWFRQLVPAFVEMNQEFFAAEAAAQAVAPFSNPDPFVADDDKPPASLSKVGELILGALLAKYPSLRSVDEICSDVKNWSDKTVKRNIKCLIEDGLLARPQGPRRGATLTDAGKVLATKIAAPK